MSQVQYCSPVAIPIVENVVDDYRTFHPNRRWLISVLVNGKRYYFGSKKEFISRLTWCNTVHITHDIMAATASHSMAGRYLTEVSPKGYNVCASVHAVQLLLGLSIAPRVKIEIGMVEVTDEEPSWKTHVFKPIEWHAQYWTDL
jgi:hypothetical protein